MRTKTQTQRASTLAHMETAPIRRAWRLMLFFSVACAWSALGVSAQAAVEPSQPSPITRVQFAEAQVITNTASVQTVTNAAPLATNAAPIASVSPAPVAHAEVAVTPPPAQSASAPATSPATHTKSAPTASQDNLPTAPPVALTVPLTAFAIGKTNPAPASGTNAAPETKSAIPAWEFFAETNAPAATELAETTNATPARHEPGKPIEDAQAQFEIAHHFRLAGQFEQATAAYAAILQGNTPEKIQRAALLELAQVALEQNDLPRAQQIYAQCLARWPSDLGVPELFLRQGLLFRQMGLPNQAIAKFYAVMTSALVLKPDRFDNYQKLVLKAQNEIAETQYELGNYAEAADSFTRLLRLDAPPANRTQIQYRLIRCLAALARRTEATTQARDFLEKFPDAPERPEVHFLAATALKQAGRDAEALAQVLALLREQRTGATRNPQTLAYWQGRAGNEIGNQFYRQGDAMKALDIYLALASLDTTVEWQMPVWYQIGLIFEHLKQPTKAAEYYAKIVSREKDLPATVSPSLKTVVDMARWRQDFTSWQLKTETASLSLRSSLLGTARTNSIAAQP